MGLAASAVGRLGSGPSPRVTRIATSRARATTKEAPEKYEWKRLAAVNSDNALNRAGRYRRLSKLFSCSRISSFFCDRAVLRRTKAKDTRIGPLRKDQSCEPASNRLCAELGAASGRPPRTDWSRRAGWRCSTAGGEFL